MNFQEKTKILQQLDTKLKEMNRNDRKMQEYYIKRKLYNKNEYIKYMKKIQKEIMLMDIEEIEFSVRAYFK